MPVLATAAVIAAGPTALLGPVTVLRLRALTWTGVRSYSIYLWHWPALVLVAAAIGPLSLGQRLVTVLASVVVAAVTFAVLEDPIRHWTWLAARARRGLVMGGGLIAIAATTSVLVVATSPTLVGAGEAAAPVVATVSTLPPSPVPTRAVPSWATPVSSAPTTAPRSAAAAPAPAAAVAPTTAAPPAPTVPPTTPPTTAPLGPEDLAAINRPQLSASLLTNEVPANLRPAVRSAANDVPEVDHDGCNLDATVTMPGPCTFGDPASSTTIVLFGDSHAAQWFPALEQLSEQHHWRLEVMTKKGCPTAAISVFSPMVNRELRECAAWRVNVADRLAAEHPTLVLMSSFRYRQQMGPWAGVEPNEAWREGLTTTLDTFTPLASKVLVLGDTPTPASDVPSCVASHLGTVAACAAARSDAVRDDRLQVEREVAAAHGAAFVPTSDWLCTDAGCPVIVGDVLVYRDNNHLTATAATWLAPYLDAAITPLVAPPAPVAAPTAPRPCGPCGPAAAPVTAPAPAVSAPPPTTAEPPASTAPAPAPSRGELPG